MTFPLAELRPPLQSSANYWTKASRNRCRHIPASRGAEARSLFQAMTDQEASAIMIQSLWRGYATCTAYKQKRALAITVQSIYRGLLLRREIRFLGACASGIQASWRCYWAKLQYRFDVLDLILVQSAFRRRSTVKFNFTWERLPCQDCNLLFGCVTPCERLNDYGPRILSTTGDMWRLCAYR